MEALVLLIVVIALLHQMLGTDNDDDFWDGYS